jgi:phosphopantothenoylcysteine decarboxylase/phosphopantothenate--cysteine ligase
MKGRHILLGVTGGIAAYKSADLASKLVQKEAEVRVVMTRSATEFVTPLTFESLTRNPVYLEMFEADREFNPRHVAISDWVELLIVAPATANIMGKYAHGIADDLLSTLLLCVDCPILMAPAMNAKMWANRVVQDNFARLKDLGVHFIGPDEGFLACGWTGKGRMSQPADILSVAEKLLG